MGCASLLLALGCATYSEPAADAEQWSASVKRGASAAASATVRGASATRSALGTAARGVREGYAEPEPAAYGPFPREYAASIRAHMRHFEGVSPEASLQLGRPEKGYLNAGLLAGGGVAWQGWLVPLRVVESAMFASQTRPAEYVVRMRDGAVVEVMPAEYADALRWAERDATANAERAGAAGAGPARRSD